ncbi:uncharacterized protein LOC111345666 [Stylophora pistillata]|uniref:Uncharacterized protein n=1 Tax=Stylophora pistillata TaxID=50429 RepID=A0A2B4RAC4_STYPI|nr:uncharacterized protein LOC111345666 [Stylophora pistillata]PFX13759.1 hypothetical protein AWC38_SpisGene22133 [Stylophora pistillata]
MNNRPGGEAVIAVQERARIGGVEVSRQTVIAATDEGIVAVQVDSVGQVGGNRSALPLPGGRPALAGGPRYPTPAVSYEDERGCTDYCCLACDSDYKWYSLKGKGCFWFMVLLLFYLIVGTILLPFFIIYLVCLCICYPLGCCKDNDDTDRPLFRS